MSGKEIATRLLANAISDLKLKDMTLGKVSRLVNKYIPNCKCVPDRQVKCTHAILQVPVWNYSDNHMFDIIQTSIQCKCSE